MLSTKQINLIFFLLLYVTLVEKKKVSQGFLFFVLIVLSMSKLSPWVSDISVQTKRGTGQAGVEDDP